MSKVFGIDVSVHQKGFDFKKAKNEGVKFAILRGAYSTSKDKQFETHYKNAKAQGLDVGVYLYTRATNVKEAKAEAEALYNNCLKGKQFEMPIYIDIEAKIHTSLCKKTNTEIVKTFCEYLEGKGFWVGIYSFKYFFEKHLNDDELQNYAHWIAQWSTECTYKGKDGVLGLWQFGGETNKIRTNKVAGVVCDQNYMLVDYPSKIKAAGLNGFSKKSSTTTKPAAKPVSKPATKTTTYVIKKGDTLGEIAKKFSTTVSKLAKDNNIKNVNKIYAGKKLIIKK